MLYPDNEIAAKTGSLLARVNPDGSASLALPTVEAMAGRFSELSGTTTGFGALLRDSSVGAVGITTPGTRYGVMTLVGDRGTRMNCEWQAGSAGQGAGVCATNTNARYRIMW